MIEQTVKVIAIEGKHAWVESLSLHGCAKCEAGEGCGGGIFSKLFGNKQFRMKIENSLNVDLHENIVIGVEDSAVTNASLLSYLMPLVGLSLGATLGHNVDTPESEFWTLIGSLVGISLSFLLARLRLNSDSYKAKYTPIMIKKQNSLQKFEPTSS
jgi:sigma-E factor negative regulatory protein RseC